jgi:hypothetical protein
MQLGKHSLRVRELGSSRQGFGVFPLAVAACEWLVANENVVKGRAVLELGCGCGIVGITAVKCGARAAWLTDYDHDVCIGGRLFTTAGWLDAARLNLCMVGFSHDVLRCAFSS